MTGKIIKGIAGFYYVHIPGQGVLECKARGVFRNQSIKPLIGDNVVVEMLENEEMKGNILDVLPRDNELIRPAVANIDHVMIVFSVNQPKPNLNLLDRFLISVEKVNIKSSICFNKIDTLPKEEIKNLEDIYSGIGYQLFLTSALNEEGLGFLMPALINKTTVFAGPSGVGKSTLLNLIQKEVPLETGSISVKIQRGKHTTRHAELICFNENSYVVDTPGFSSLSLDSIDKDDLKNYFLEFTQYEDQCKFIGCNHINEPKCGVKTAVAEGKISQSRYNNYTMLFEELKEIRRW